MSAATAFDNLAADYDATFTERLPARWLRQRVRETACNYLVCNGHILELGCGTGEDAIWLAENGHTVIATDISSNMLEQTREKVQKAPLAIRERISIARHDAGSSELPAGRYDAIWSNFGALNCVADLRPLLGNAADRMHDNGILALVIMGRFCLWETLGFGLRGDFDRARRRWRGRSGFSTNGAGMDVWYHGAQAVRDAAYGLEMVDLRGIGVFVPPSEFFSICERRPRLLRVLARLDRWLGGIWPFNRLGDHYLIVLRKTA